MYKSLETVCLSLDDLGKSITDNYSEDKTLSQIWGWNFPALDRHDLSELATNISKRVKEYGTENIDKDYLNYINAIPERIKVFKTSTLPYFYNGSGAAACSAYITLIEWITSTLNPIIGWEVLNDNKALPTQLTKRLRAIQTELNEIVPEKESLESQIKLIKDATDAAESLPTDLASLKDARNKVDNLSTQAAELFGKIDTYYKDAEKIDKYLIAKKEESDKIVANCEEAYRITTTKGLAAAFDQRANKLSNTMWIWVIGLLASLCAGALIGASRFKLMTASLGLPNPNWGVIWMDFALSIIGLAAPVWFAWLATKQISQRFRLAEDYAFKASVAKAYEGYRKEAARIDPAFEARLFGSALERLEEAPLRVIGDDMHSSPWQEFFSSPAFHKAIDTIPEFKDKVATFAKDSMNMFKSQKRTDTKGNEDEKA